jgi:hypothetical protein
MNNFINNLRVGLIIASFVLLLRGFELYDESTRGLIIIFYFLFLSLCLKK